MSTQTTPIFAPWIEALLSTLKDGSQDGATNLSITRDDFAVVEAFVAREIPASNFCTDADLLTQCGEKEDSGYLTQPYSTALGTHFATIFKSIVLFDAPLSTLSSTLPVPLAFSETHKIFDDEDIKKHLQVKITICDESGTPVDNWMNCPVIEMSDKGMHVAYLSSNHWAKASHDFTPQEKRILNGMLIYRAFLSLMKNYMFIHLSHFLSLEEEVKVVLGAMAMNLADKVIARIGALTGDMLLQPILDLPSEDRLPFAEKFLAEGSILNDTPDYNSTIYYINTLKSVTSPYCEKPTLN